MSNCVFHMSKLSLGVGGSRLVQNVQVGKKRTDQQDKRRHSRRKEDVRVAGTSSFLYIAGSRSLFSVVISFRVFTRHRLFPSPVSQLFIPLVVGNGRAELRQYVSHTADNSEMLVLHVCIISVMDPRKRPITII